MENDPSRVTTKITRSEMAIAKRADPRNKSIHWRKKEEAREMLASIIERMGKLTTSMCAKAYTRFAHHTDRAMELNDLIATVRENLVLGIYRYRIDGKYDPYFYLMGVINVVLRNVHNWRNRKKRLPPAVENSLILPGKNDTWTCSKCGERAIGRQCPCGATPVVERAAGLVSMDTPSKTTDDGTLMDEVQETEVSENSIISISEVEHIFRGVQNKIYHVQSNGRKRSIRGSEITSRILKGMNLSSISTDLKVHHSSMKRLISESILRDFKI